MKRFWIGLSIFLSVLILSSCNTQSSYDIVTSDYVLYDLVSHIVEDDLSIHVLTPPNTNYHHFEPTSNDLITIKNAKSFLFLGYDYNPWLKDLNTLETYLNKDAIYLDVSTLVEEDLDHDDENHHEHHHGLHYWVDPNIVIEILDDILEVIIPLKPEYATIFETRKEAYQDEIAQLIEQFELELEHIENRTIYYIGHYSHQAFAKRFGLEIKPLNESITPGSVPTSHNISSFIKALNDNQVKTIFYEEGTNPIIIDVVKNQTEVIQAFELHGYHQLSKTDYDNQVSYKDLFERNITHILEVLEDV